MNAIYRAALGMLREPAAAEDLLQETYREAWTSFHRYQPGTDCKAWLFRILFRLRSKQRRQESRFEWVELDEVSQELLSSADEPIRLLDRQDIIKTLESLPEHYRNILILADAEQFSYAEIASILDLPKGTVMSRLNRARSLFRQRFLNEGDSSKSA